MRDSLKKPKPTLESLLKESQVIAGKDLIKRKEDKAKEMALLQEAIDFEKRHRKPKGAEKLKYFRLGFKATGTPIFCTVS